MVNTLLIDIETSPIIGYTWGMYDQNVLRVIQPTKIICGAWKWLGADKGDVVGLCDYADYKKGVVDDYSLVAELWGLLDKADIVVAHNGDSFDIKSMNARFVANGINSPSYYTTVDTLKVARKYFRFNTNKLDNLGEYLGLGHKAASGGFGTWVGCMEGDEKAWALMKKYNLQDVNLLEKVYLKLRPYIRNHPNLNAINPKAAKGDKLPCTVCESFNTQRRGFLTTKMGRYQRHQCNDCGSWSSGPYEKVPVL